MTSWRKSADLLARAAQRRRAKGMSASTPLRRQHGLVGAACFETADLAGAARLATKTSRQEMLGYLDRHLTACRFSASTAIAIAAISCTPMFPASRRNFFFSTSTTSGWGPCVQDFWMLCLGDEDEAEQQLEALACAATGSCAISIDRELHLLEPLRGLADHPLRGVDRAPVERSEFPTAFSTVRQRGVLAR